MPDALWALLHTAIQDCEAPYAGIGNTLVEAQRFPVKSFDSWCIQGFGHTEASAANQPLAGGRWGSPAHSAARDSHLS